MTISLSVILIETTGNIAFALPIIITITSAKLMGDVFNGGIYDTQIEISNAPMLSWYVTPRLQGLKIRNIAGAPVVCVRMRERMSYIVSILKKNTHNAFPVVDSVESGNRSNGRIQGIILRSQLIVILKRSYFEETKRFWSETVSIEVFRNEYPRFPTLADIHIHEDKTLHNYHINLRMFMNPTPYCVKEETSVPRVFQMFRALGLRHLVIVDSDNRVRGIVTRKDFLEHH